MRLLRRRRYRYAVALALLTILLMATYVAFGVVGVLRNRGPSLPLMPRPGPTDRILIIAPHEDDETLGCGGYLQAAIHAGAPVYVCLMTAGEGEELGAAWVTRRPPLAPGAYIRLGQVRRRESLNALASIGLPPDHVFFLDYPNMGLSAMWTARYFSAASPWTSRFTRTAQSPFAGSFTPHAPFCGAAVLADLETVITRVRPTSVFTMHPGDIHPDHWATYCFTQLALAEMRARHAMPEHPSAYAYIVHRRGWPVPWGYYPHLPLTPPPALLNLRLNRWLTFPLTSQQVSQKNRMIAAYRSQAPPFDMLMRAFDRRNEIFAQLAEVQMQDGKVSDPTLLQEPRRETELLRRRPDADLAWLDLSRTDQSAVVSVQTVAPVRGRTVVLVNLTVAQPLPHHPRALLVQYEKGKPLQTWLAMDARVPPTPAPLPINVVQRDNEITFTLPPAYAGAGQPVMLDVLVKLRGRVVDHGLTRLFRFTHEPTLPPRQDRSPSPANP